MKGWKYDSYRHSLASHGVKSRDYWRKKYPDLVKNFPGENPRITENFIRFRQQDPSKFSQFRVKAVKPGKQVVLGRSKETGEFELQSVLIAKNPVNRNSMAYKVVQDGVDVGTVDNVSRYRNIPRFNPKAHHTVVYDDAGNIAAESWVEDSRVGDY